MNKIQRIKNNETFAQYYKDRVTSMGEVFDEAYNFIEKAIKEDKSN